MALITDCYLLDDKDANGYEAQVENALRGELQDDPLGYGYENMTDVQVAEKLMSPQVIYGTTENYVPVDEEDPETLYEKVTDTHIVSLRQPRWYDIINGLAYASNSVSEADITSVRGV